MRSFVWILMFSCVSSLYALDVVQDEKAVAVIISGNNETEKHAAAELAKYVKLASGATLSEGTVTGTGIQNIILLGSPSTNPAIAKLEKDGLLKFPEKEALRDGFIIKTLNAGSNNYLILGGHMPRGTLYAVYSFLERFLNIGFFWESDIVPAARTIAVNDIDICDIPFYSIRQYPQECTTGYSMRAWNLNDWKKELDWMAKTKLNTFLIVHDEAQSGDVLAASPKDIYNYARLLGMDVVLFFAPFDIVDEAFVKANPKNRFIKISWAGNPAGYLISPDDELFVKKGQALFATLAASYGKANIYKLHPFGEFTLEQTPEELTKTRENYAKSMMEILRRTDPDGKFFIYGWPFSCPFVQWSKQDVKTLLNAFPDNKIYVGDAWGDENPTYKKYDYFYGKKWVLGIIYMFGNMDFMQGNIKKAIDTFHALANDSKARNCAGIDINPEITHYNEIYMNLLTRLCWNPQSVTYEGFIDDYVSKRFGGSNKDIMKAALNVLIDAAYSEVPGTEAMYHKRQFANPLGLDLLLNAKVRYSSRINGLFEALTLYLGAHSRFTDNSCYKKDLADIARQYLAELINRHFIKARRAYFAGNLAMMKEEKGAIDELFNLQESILSACPEYQVKSWLDKEKTLKITPERYEKILKDNALTFATQEWLIDYPSKDIYELLKYYYRPRVDTLFKLMEASLVNKTKLSDAIVAEEYRKIENSWVTTPLKTKMPVYNNNSPLADIVTGALDVIKKEKLAEGLSEEVPFNELKREEAGKKEMIEPVWTEDFQDTSKWKITYFKEGSFSSENGTACLKTIKSSNICFGTKLNMPINKAEWLEFCYMQPDRFAESSFVMWILWTDVSGKEWRSRIWQSPSDKGQWKTVALNLKYLLSVIGEPRKINGIWIEGLAGFSTCFDWIKLGDMKEGNSK